MAKKIKKGKIVCWVDPDGIATPEKYIQANVKRRDELVTKVMDKVKSLHKTMIKEKEVIEGEIDKYLSELAGEYGEDWKGNAQLVDFAGENMVVVKINKIVSFDEKLQIAKQKIDKLIGTWSKGASSKIVALVNQAFQVDSKGKLDKRRILGLQKLKIEDPEWEEAMQIINDSIQIERTKRYVAFFERDEDGEYKPIVLNFSSL